MKNLLSEKTRYQIRNWRSHLRAIFLGSYIWVEDKVANLIVGHRGFEGRAKVLGTLGVKLLRADGSVLDLGCVSKRVVTTAGVNYMRDDFNAATGAADITNFKYHDSGTGTTAEAIGDTDLVTPAGPTTRATGSQSGAVSKQYVTVGTISYTGALAITEHGVFNQAARGAGSTLWDRSVFAAINVVNLDSIQFTYTLTIADGG